jgi:hypothetical protein
MTDDKRGKSRRRAHVKRRHATATARVKMPKLERSRNDWGLVAVRGIAFGFLLGGAIALSEGHGELPGHFFPQPQPVAQLTISASSTSSLS